MNFRNWLIKEESVVSVNSGTLARSWLEQSEPIPWRFLGPLNVILGDHSPETLHYGTAKSHNEPMLYIPLMGNMNAKSAWASHFKSIRKQKEKVGIWCKENDAKVGGYDCQEFQTDKYKDRANLMHVGEYHVTVAYGNELKAVQKTLAKQQGKSPDSSIEFLLKGINIQGEWDNVGPLGGKKLFDEDGKGIECWVYPDGETQLTYGAARSYITPHGTPPIALIQPIRCPMIEIIRNALNLPKRPNSYKAHVTIGYIVPQKIGSYLGTVDINPKFTARAIAGHHAKQLYR